MRTPPRLLLFSHFPPESRTFPTPIIFQPFSIRIHLNFPPFKVPESDYFVKSSYFLLDFEVLLQIGKNITWKFNKAGKTLYNSIRGAEGAAKNFGG